jgi:Phage integrase family
VSDIDLVNGTLSVNKARVAGIDRCQTKTGDDRRIALCSRALGVIKRQLALRARFMAAGSIRHDHRFFRETGEPFTNLQIQARRWRLTLESLQLRYRRPYAARHTFVSWNLMAGKNPLWVAKQHGHSLTTMLRVYAAWAEDAVDSDVEAIRRAMNRHTPLKPAHRCPYSVQGRLRPARPAHRASNCNGRTRRRRALATLAVDLPVEAAARSVSVGYRREMYGGKGGNRTLDPGIMSATHKRKAA